jgi:hypothetical protein
MKNESVCLDGESVCVCVFIRTERERESVCVCLVEEEECEKGGEREAHMVRERERKQLYGMLISCLKCLFSSLSRSLSQVLTHTHWSVSRRSSISKILI